MKLILSMLLFFTTLFCHKVIAQTLFAVGDTAEAKDKVGLWLPVVILDKKGEEYKVHFVGYTSDYYDTWVGPERIRSLKNKNNTANKERVASKEPLLVGGVPKIVGTAWWLQAIYKKGTTPKPYHSWPPFIFCKRGRWELQNNYTQSGTYQVQGKRLMTTGSGSDKLRETYVISWNAQEKYMELTASDNTVLRLKYNTTSDCGKADQ